MRALVTELLPRFSLNKPAPTLIHVPDTLLLAINGRGSELDHHVNIKRENPQYSVSVVDLKDSPESTRLVYLKGHFYKVNATVPSIVTSENCSAEWLDKEKKCFYGLNYEMHEHFGVLVTLKKGDSFTLQFGKDVYADVNDIYVWNVQKQNSQGVNLSQLIEDRTRENAVGLKQ